MTSLNGHNVFHLEDLAKGWEACLLEDAVTIRGGSQPPKSVFKTEPEEGYVRLIQIRDYKSDKYLTYLPKSSTKKFCTKEDIMIGRYGPPVFQILRGLEGAYNVALMKAEPKGNMDRDFLFYLLSSPPIQNLVVGNSQRTAGQTGVNLKLLNSCIIPLPPLATQKKIAAILDAADTHRQKTKALLAKYDELAQSIFLDMFGDPVTNPKGWEKEEFSRIVTNVNSKRVPIKQGERALIQGEYPYYGATGVVDYINNFKFDGEFLLVAEDGKNLVSRTKPIAWVVKGKFWVNNHAHVLEFNGRANLSFLAFQLNRLDISQYVTGIDQFKLNKNNLNKLSLLMPPLELQIKFAEQVELMEIQKTMIRTNSTNSENLFNSLLQKAFKGELVGEE